MCCCSAEGNRKSMIYSLSSAASCVLHTINPGFFSLMMLRMKLELSSVLTGSFSDTVGNVFCSIFLVESL